MTNPQQTGSAPMGTRPYFPPNREQAILTIRKAYMKVLQRFIHPTDKIEFVAVVGACHAAVLVDAIPDEEFVHQERIEQVVVQASKAYEEQLRSLMRQRFMMVMTKGSA